MFFNDFAYAMGNAAQSAEGNAFGSPISMNILLMVVIFAIFYFLIIRPQHQEAKRLKAMLASLKKGDKVITVGGIYGVITDIKDEDIIILDLGDSTIEIGRKYISGIAEGKHGLSKHDRKNRGMKKNTSNRETSADTTTEKDTEEQVNEIPSEEETQTQDKKI